MRYPAELLAAQVELVDTPGVNDISQQKVEVTYGIVPRADLVLFLLDATQVLKHSELRFIEQRMLGGLGERLIFVISKIDRLDAEEAEEVIRYARERLEASLGPGVLIFPISARRASRPRATPASPCCAPTSSTSSTANATTSCWTRRSATGLRSGNALLGNLRIKLRGYQMTRQELDTRVIAVRQKLRDSQRVIAQNVAQIDDACGHLRDQAQQHLNDFRDAFLASLPREVEKASAEDVQRYLPGFIEDCFRRFLDAEGRATARALETLAEEIIAVTSENLKETLGALQRELGIDPSALTVDIDSTAYDVSVFAMGAFGVSVLIFNMLLGSLIALATPVVALVLKDKLEARIKHKATETGLDAIRSGLRPCAPRALSGSSTISRTASASSSKTRATASTAKSTRPSARSPPSATASTPTPQPSKPAPPPSKPKPAPSSASCRLAVSPSGKEGARERAPRCRLFRLLELSDRLEPPRALESPRQTRGL